MNYNIMETMNPCCRQTLIYLTKRVKFIWLEHKSYLTERKVYLTKKGHDHVCKGGLGSRWKVPEQENKQRDKWINKKTDMWMNKQTTNTWIHKREIYQ